MKRSVYSKVVLLLGCMILLGAMPLASNQASLPSSRHKVVVKASSRAELRRLSGWLNRNDFDVAGVNIQRGTLDVLTDDEGLRVLKSKKIAIEKTSVLPVVSGNHFMDLDQRYLDPSKVEKRMRDIQSRFPKVTQMVEIGRSLRNLPIYALVISTTPDLNDPRFHAKPSVLVDGMHHAREIMTPEVVFDIGETLLGAANRIRRARQIIENMNVVIVPMLNVDGNARVWTEDNFWRKNARSDSNSSSSVYGVDINRNYPYRWNGCDGSSGAKSSDAYRGASAASEPETRALMSIAEKIHPMASLSYHSYSELVLYPYGCEGEHTAEQALLKKLGNEMAEMLPTDNGRGHYTPGTPWEILYSVDGDSMGYLFSEYGAVAYTFEVNQAFQPSYEVREPTLKKHRVAWQYFLDQVQQRLLTVQVRDAAGRPVVADLDIAEIPHKKGERNFSTNVEGNYFKVLLPGHYAIRVKTKNGLKGMIDVEMGESPQVQTVTVQ